MRTALVIFSLFLFGGGLCHGQTFGLGGVTELRPVRSQVFGLSEPISEQRLQVQPVAIVREVRTVQPVAQPQAVCIDGKCYPQPTRQGIQRQPLLRRWR